MGRGRVRLQLVALAIVIVAGQIALCAALRVPKHYVPNYGEELSELEREIPVKDGLAWGYYRRYCPRAESIVARRVAAYLRRDRGVAAGLLRLVTFPVSSFYLPNVDITRNIVYGPWGCDASILLKLSEGTELDDLPNLTIRTSALQLIDDIKRRIECACPRTVSCADIVVLAAKVAVQKVGGPSFHVPLGRRDSLCFSPTTSDLPSPFTTFEEQRTLFCNKGLETADLVALAGAHTLGEAHCGTFSNRLLPTVDPKLHPAYASYLLSAVCPTVSSTNATGLDFYSPNRFDNQYFQNLPNGGALLQSDQNLDQDSTAWGLVLDWAGNQRHFFNQFSKAFIRMSQIQVLTGNSGEIRKVCSLTNSGVADSSVEELSCFFEPEIISEDETVELAQTVDSSVESEPELVSMVVDGKAKLNSNTVITRTAEIQQAHDGLLRDS